MILIADSGSTKSIWYLSNNKQQHIFYSNGLNPYLLSKAVIAQHIREELLPQLGNLVNEIEAIYFYGAGCASSKNQEIVGQALLYNFSACSKIVVRSDIWASILASCGHEKGICCILGTGTNSCVYDGHQIIDQLPSLGYMLGDEGSGCAIGKALLQAYFYREMPAHLAAAFENQFEGIEEHHFVSTLFATDRPNQFLASFTEFAVQHRTDSFIQDLLQSVFEVFVQRHLLKYESAKEWPIHFVGSVAHGFQEEMTSVLNKYQLKVGRFLKMPFPALSDYHINPSTYSI